MTPVVVIRAQLGPNDELRGRGCWLWCPACNEAHRPQIAGEADDLPVGPCWTWNGRDDEHFGVEPSYLTWTGDREKPTTRCHSFIRDGHWQFLGDCTHELKGQMVPLVPLPDWLV